MAIYIPESDGIYFSKTREYFEEVLSSYANGNYRSAIVMLYSIAICDILFKLQELKDMFNDPIANEILCEINKMRNAHDNKSKSKWEKELIDSVYHKTELLDLESYTNLNHLYDHRNFSAHPALNENYELITPSRETTIAHIRNTLNDILLKPPIFIKNIIDTLTEDLKEKGEIYRGRYKELAIYLGNKYYCKMPESMKLTTLRALWKFCFCLPDDKDCMNNHRINRMALEILIDDIPKVAIAYIKKNPNLFTASVNLTCMASLIVMLSSHTEVYSALSSELKLQIGAQIEKHSNLRVISWFRFSSLKDHIKDLQSMEDIGSDSTALKLLNKHYRENGQLSLLIDYFIDYYGGSKNFDTANQRFEVGIRPFLNQMTSSQFEQLIATINGNDQIYNRWLAQSTNTEIAKKAKTVLGDNFDYSAYPHFVFDIEATEEFSENNLESTEYEDDILWV